MALNEKCSSIETRLQQVRQSDQEDMTKARQAETDAATAYAQAVAWGDVEGEKAANEEAQKGAKKTSRLRLSIIGVNNCSSSPWSRSW